MRFVRSIANGEILAIMIDQHTTGNSIPVEFFGREAATTPSVAMLHLVTKAPIVVAYALRTGPLRYAVHAVGPFTFKRSGDRASDVRTITQALTREIEEIARAHPEQYMWDTGAGNTTRRSARARQPRPPRRSALDSSAERPFDPSEELARMSRPQNPTDPPAPVAWPTFSLLFFASEQADYSDGKFDLLRRSTAFVDEAGFEAVWMPERHFHAFGGIFPNPALTAALLAETTERIRLRAGSVVLPLHSPIRVAEDWAVIDNMSDGRVDLAFAVGWNPNDFAIAPERYEDRVRTTFEGIELVKKLWRGETIQTPNGLGQPIELCGSTRRRASRS